MLPPNLAKLVGDFDDIRVVRGVSQFVPIAVPIVNGIIVVAVLV
jgi:hypothetical protein